MGAGQQRDTRGFTRAVPYLVRLHRPIHHTCFVTYNAYRRFFSLVQVGYEYEKVIDL